jgi:capsular polysaccharide biosynthesis protein
MAIGKITQVDLRDLWKQEASDFTQWLSENLSDLCDAVDMNFELLKTEQRIDESRFVIDILAEDDSGEYVIIENQLERTDHTHLGQIITYASLPQMSHKFESQEWGPHLLAKHSFKEIPEKTLILGGQKNYYHWMINWISKLSTLEAARMMDSFDSILLPELYDLEPYHLESLRCVKGLDGKKWIHLKANEVARAVGCISVSIIPNPIHAPHHLAWLRKKFCQTPEARSFPKIYISRGDAAARRRILNETEVMDLLADFGYKSVTLSSLSISEQAALFASAKNIIAPHGAGLANLVFCSPQTQVCEFQSAKRSTRVYMSLGKYTNCDSYDILKCDPADGSDSNIVDLTVPLGELKKILAKYEAHRKPGAHSLGHTTRRIMHSIREVFTNKKSTPENPKKEITTVRL